MIVFSAAWLVKIVQRFFLYKFGRIERKLYLCSADLIKSNFKYILESFL